MAGDRNPGRPGSSRRQFLFGGAAAGLGAATALGAEFALSPGTASEAPPATTGGDTVPFFGAHQAGIATPVQAHAVFLALDLLPDVTRPDLVRMMRVLTSTAARLADGSGPLTDIEPELAATPSRLTVTFGFGPGLLERAGVGGPVWLRPLPAFAVDRLEERWTGGDLLLQIGSDDPLALAHARRMLLKDTRTFATLRWAQNGFDYARGTVAEGTTPRNMFGQVDGTANPRGDELADVVWIADGPLAGGTGMVLRRIRMDLEGWDLLGRRDRELAVGRTLDTGAPLTGSAEHDEPDLDARDAIGLPVIPAFAHLRRARSDDPRQRILRRPYNYDDAPDGDGISESGQIFVAYQADVDAQFVPIQQRLAALDLMNEWTTPIGSAVFLVPPGCDPDGYVGETVLG